MKKYKNKYFDAIKYKDSCTESLLYEQRFAKDKRSKKWKKQRKKYGGWDARATWNLNTLMIEQIYTWLKMYFDEADRFIDLSFYKFQINEQEMTERDAILLAIDDIEYYLCNSERLDEDLGKICNTKAAEAFRIIGIIFPALWW